VTQGTTQWKKDRNQYIGASDAAVILGISPYKTPFALWEEKLGLGKPQVESDAMKFGKDNELPARLLYELMSSNLVEPTIQPIFHKTIPYMACNLDGLTQDGTWAVEIKCNNKENHALAKAETIPGFHYAQMQHQLACLDHPAMDYFSYYKGEGIIVDVGRDPEYITKLLKAEKAFWDCVQNLEEPPLIDRDFRERGELWSSRAKMLWEIEERIRADEKIAKELKEELKQMSEGVNSRAGEYRFQVSSRRGLINYGAVPELKDVDLEKYRKSATKTWRLKKS
jgi:putative phage-type endonuclease